MKKLCLLVAFLFIAFFSMAQVNSVAGPVHAPLTIGFIDHIPSAQLMEDRTLNIYLPAGYNKDSTTRYPVIYLLDGSKDEDFIHIAGLVQFLTMIQAMPSSIVVGIANVDRKRDFTYPSTVQADVKLVPTSGGSAKFMAFIEKELQPYIQKAYNVNERKTIVGQSLGGLMATEILLKKPSLFTDYIIVSPSLWWDNEALLKSAPALHSSHPYKGIKAYIAYGSEGSRMIGDAQKLLQVLQADRNLKSTGNFMAKEDHLTILHNAAYNALIWLNKSSIK